MLRWVYKYEENEQVVEDYRTEDFFAWLDVDTICGGMRLLELQFGCMRGMYVVSLVTIMF